MQSCRFIGEVLAGKILDLLADGSQLGADLIQQFLIRQRLAIGCAGLLELGAVSALLQLQLGYGLLGLAAVAHHQEEAKHGGPQGSNEGNLERGGRAGNQHDDAGHHGQHHEDDEADLAQIRLGRLGGSIARRRARLSHAH